MNKVVHKIQLPEPGQPKEYILTYGFVTRHVSLQHGQPMLWFEVVVEEQRKVEIKVRCIGTGWPLDTDYWYIGTVVAKSGFVWHYYAKYINE